MAATDKSALNGLFNTIYDRARFVVRETNLMTNLVDVVSATGWMDRKISTRPAATAISVAETQDFNAPTTMGKTLLATLTPGEIMAQAVLTDQAIETDPDPAQSDASFELGGAIATKIDVDLLSTFANFTTDKGDGANATATFAKFAAAVSVVNNNTKRSKGMLQAVLHPYHWHDFWLELGKPAATLTNLQGITEEALRNYYMADLLGVRIYTSSNIAVDGSDDAVSGIFVKPAIMLDVRRQLRFEEERDASARAWELNANAGYAYGVVHADYGVKFTADATAPA